MIDRALARRRWRAAAMTLTAVALSFTGACSGNAGNNSQSNGPVTLSEMDYYGTEPNKAALGQLLDSCASTVGGTIKRHAVEDLRTSVLQLTAAQSLPDLRLFYNP